MGENLPNSFLNFQRSFEKMDLAGGKGPEVDSLWAGFDSDSRI
jgi:hypothetical protein